jgi:heat shock protein HslJ
MKLMLVLLSVAIMSASGAQNSSTGLSGTTWQLVKFQGPDERVFTPDDKSKYTVSFGRSGGVIATIDCNTARSTWRVTAPGQLKFGSWSRTSAKCGAGSLHDQIVRDGGAVQKFEIKDGHLFLSGMESGGYYELEPWHGVKRQ